MATPAVYYRENKLNRVPSGRAYSWVEEVESSENVYSITRHYAENWNHLRDTMITGQL